VRALAVFALLITAIVLVFDEQAVAAIVLALGALAMTLYDYRRG
jgi:hypothetical protein